MVKVSYNSYATSNAYKPNTALFFTVSCCPSNLPLCRLLPPIGTVYPLGRFGEILRYPLELQSIDLHATTYISNDNLGTVRG